METENTAPENAPVETAVPEPGRNDFTEEEKTALARYVELTEMAKAERDKCLVRHTKGTLCAYIARLRADRKKKAQ
jgi:hypothetical protein